jgi:death-on-curing protein
VIFLDLESLLHLAGRTLGGDPAVCDYGLLESALARPQASAFGEDAYPDVASDSAPAAPARPFGIANSREYHCWSRNT